MKYTRKCENCIWFNQCHEDEVCEDYFPASTEEQEAAEIEEYEADLYMRHELYQEQVAEQND